jgi:hypothetical protein
MTAGRHFPDGTEGPSPGSRPVWLRIVLLALAGLVLATDASAWCNIGTSCNTNWSHRRKLL